jgi:DNA-binding NarL/FixJ family response regulator
MAANISDERWSLIRNLSQSEYAIFKALGKGNTIRQIAEQRGVTIKTVETQVASMKAKLRIPWTLKVAVTAAEFRFNFGEPRIKRRIESDFVTK